MYFDRRVTVIHKNHSDGLDILGIWSFGFLFRHDDSHVFHTLFDKWSCTPIEHVFLLFLASFSIRMLSFYFVIYCTCVWTKQQLEISLFCKAHKETNSITLWTHVFWKPNNGILYEAEMAGGATFLTHWEIAAAILEIRLLCAWSL